MGVRAFRVELSLVCRGGIWMGKEGVRLGLVGGVGEGLRNLTLYDMMAMVE